MADTIYFNPKYHIANEKTVGIFSTFHLFKHNGKRLGEELRPPYPIIKSNASFMEIIYNLNKSDGLFYVTIMGIGFMFSAFATSRLNLMRHKITLNHYLMHSTNLVALFLLFGASSLRLGGHLPNGLSWKNVALDDANMYDLSTEFESQSMFKKA